MATNFGFRSDINGLRALAISAVLIYHFAASYLPGGFAGVDVFFVISGFLMTSIICNKIVQQNFSLFDFYLARFTRIAPPLVILCSIVSIFGWFFFPPQYFESMHKHIAGSLSFISNILYMRESGYFDGGAQEKWLLHTWSLSVEWQFYLIYPLILLSLFKVLTVNRVKLTLTALTILGAIYCIYYTSVNPIGAFYLLPARAWEMLLGSIAYLYPLHANQSQAKKLQFFGIIIVITSYIFINHDMAWPSYWAFIPTLGTLLILLANYQGSILNTNTLVQKLGKASYSIYLWHWPVTVIFFTMGCINSFGYLLLGVLISCLLGWIAYYSIELKFSQALGRGRVFIFTLLLSLVVFSNGAYVYVNGDANSRLAGSPLNDIRPSPLREKCNLLKGQYRDPTESCEYFGNNITWATLGDSHSIEIAYALAQELEKFDVGIRQYSASACPPLFNVKSTFKECGKWSTLSLATLLNDKNIKNIVISYRYSSFLYGDNIATYPLLPDQEPSFFSDLSAEEAREKVLAALFDAIAQLSSAKEKVYIVLPIPELGENINKLALRKVLAGNARALLGSLPATSLNYYLRRHHYFINELKNINFPKNVILIDPTATLCDNQNCFSFINGRAMYFDDDHLSLNGSKKIVDQILSAHRF